MQMRQWFDQIRPQLLRRRTFPAWTVLAGCLVWRIAGGVSTVQTVWPEVQPSLKTIWAHLVGVNAHVYQTILMVLGLGWLLWIVSHPESPTVSAPVSVPIVPARPTTAAGDK